MGFSYTPSGLAKEMLTDLDGVIFEIAILTKDIVVENVWTYVYNPFHPEMYERRGEDRGFVASWDVGFEIPRGSKNSVAYRVFSNPELMDYIPQQESSNHKYKFAVHGSPDGDEDRRSFMDVAIAEGKYWDYSSPHAQEVFEAFGEDIEWWKNPRDYFTPSLETLSEQIDDMTMEAYNKIGISIFPFGMF